jgi:hypothetical protein
MRTTTASSGVRLYYLDDGDPVARTLFYGPLAEALMVAAEQQADIQGGLWIATHDDVVGYLDMIEG